MVVLNKADEEVMPLDELSIKRKFNNVSEVFHKISALTNINIDFLKDCIKKEIFNLPHASEALPISWLNVKLKIAKIRRPFIEVREFTRICKSVGLTEIEIEDFSDYAHDSGFLLHFRGHHILQNIVILKQNWLTSAVYKIFKSKKIELANGAFSYDDLKELWDDYPMHTHQYLLELSKKFELVFQIGNGSNRFIATELLPNCKSDLILKSVNPLRFELRYQFMPSGIFLKLLFRLNDLISHNTFWRNQMVIERNGSNALIKHELLEKKISISIDGSEKRVILDLIRRELDQIHDNLNNPLYTENINCICKDCTESTEPYFHDYSAVRMARMRSKKTMQCLKSFENVSIQGLLGEITGYEEVPKETNILVQGDYYENINKSMKIDKINVKGKSQANFADSIESVKFSQKLEIDEKVFDEFKFQVASMSVNQIETVVNKTKKRDKKGLQEYLIKEGFQLAKSLGYSTVFELCKYILI